MRPNSGVCGGASILTVAGASGVSASAKFFEVGSTLSASGARSAKTRGLCLVLDSWPNVRWPGDRASISSEKLLARCTAALARSTPEKLAMEKALARARDKAAVPVSMIERRRC